MRQLVALQAPLAAKGRAALPPLVVALCQLFGSRGVGGTAAAAFPRSPAPPPPSAGTGLAAVAANGDDEVQLNLPSDLGLIAQLNPDLHKAMLAHQQLQG